MNGDLDHALAVAVDVAREAGEMIRADFHRPGGARGYGDKAEVDLEAEHLIRARLRAAFPSWGYRGEETGSAGVDPPPRFLWLVDPNDGTVDFLGGRRGSSVSIGLLRDQQPVLGVVYAPSAPDDDGDFMWWAEGCGPLMRNGAVLERQSWPETLGPQEPIFVSQDIIRVPPESLAVLAPARYRLMPSIAYRIALAAVGDGCLGTSFKGAGDWDYAGAHALLRATGGELFDHEGRPVSYSAVGESRTRGCFGGARALVPTLMRRPWADVYRGPRAPSTFPPELPRAGLRRGAAIADAALLRRAHGCLLGQLAGDALGSMVEFQSAATIRRRYPEGLRSLADDGAWNTIAGQPTDDSELALALGRSILTAGGYDPEAAAKAYAYWFRSGPFDVGATTAQALRAISGEGIGNRGQGTAASGLRAQDSGLAAAAGVAANGASQSNGSLMRMSPLGIWGHRLDPDELADVARADSRLTHPNSVCQEACALFVVAVAHAVGTGAPPSEVYGFAQDWARRACLVPAVVDALAAAEHGPPTDFERNQGWVLLALQNAFYQLLQASSLEDGVVDTVMAGGDTDTNGAIAGALLGAVHGREAVPAGWRRAILSCRPLAGLPGVKRPRPQPFWPVDALELAERLLLAGR